jgi:hypothetical protein
MNLPIRKLPLMKNRTSKNLMLVFSLAATMLIPPSARAGIGLGEVWGTAWTIGNIIVGEVTLTPAYAVENWQRYVKEDPSSQTQKLRRSRVTGAYFYYTKVVHPGSATENEDAFVLDSISVINNNCTAGTSFVETHNEFIWMAKVEERGMISSDGPWTVWLKTAGQKIGRCVVRTPVDTYFWANASIGKSGGQKVTLGQRNCTLNYPFYLASDFYK